MSILKRAWRWWTGELASFLPASDLRVRAHRKAWSEIYLDSSGASLLQGQSLRSPVQQKYVVATSPDLLTLLDQVRLRGKVILSFGSGVALLRHIILAKSMLPEVETVLQNDLRRNTPFQIGQALSFWHAKSDDTVQHAVLRKKDLDEASTLLSARNLSVEAVAYRPSQEAAWPMLRDAKAALYTQKLNQFWQRAALTAVFASAAVTAGFAYSVHQHHLSTMLLLQDRSDDLRPKALERRKEIDAVENEIESLRVLARQREATPPLNVVWEELARILPDQSWLQGLSLRQGVMQIEGVAQDAEALISVIEASPAFSKVRFAAPVVKNNQGNASRFSISFEVEPKP